MSAEAASALRPVRDGRFKREPIPFRDAEDGAWLARAVPAVERCITALLDSFSRAPYTHRVEHCLHTELITALRAQPELSDVVTLTTGQRTQLVHKEWPETFVRPGKKGRGSFDVVVLAPRQTAQAGISDFLTGYIAAPIVVELGLNYPLTHLINDKNKLRDSRVLAPYLLHFSHNTPTRPAAVEKALETLGDPFRTAYAHADPYGPTIVRKGLDDTHPAALCTIGVADIV